MADNDEVLPVIRDALIVPDGCGLSTESINRIVDLIVSSILSSDSRIDIIRRFERITARSKLAQRIFLYVLVMIVTNDAFCTGTTKILCSLHSQPDEMMRSILQKVQDGVISVDDDIVSAIRSSLQL